VGNVTGAAMLREMASNMAVAVNAKLWAAPGVGRGGDDHYITQLNPDNTTRDFVDYDSNLIAVAHNIPDDDRALRVRGSCLVVWGSLTTFLNLRQTRSCCPFPLGPEARGWREMRCRLWRWPDVCL